MLNIPSVVRKLTLIIVSARLLGIIMSYDITIRGFCSASFDRHRVSEEAIR
jgi:hypothetical protein